MKNLFNRFVREEAGQDLIEYALLAGLISIVCVLAIQAAGTKVSTAVRQRQDVDSVVRRLGPRGGPSRSSPVHSPARRIRDRMTDNENSVFADRREEEGQDLIEYALLAALISVVAVLAISAVGSKLNTSYQNIEAGIP